MNTKFDVESTIKLFKQEANEHGSFSIIDKGFEILPKDYLDFWRWLFDDRDFFENDVLCRIAGYVLSGEEENNKRKLYEYVKASEVGVVWELPELNFYQEMPVYSYEEYRKKIAIEVEQKNKKEWEHLYEWSKSFHKFVCYPLSEKFLRTRSKKELKLFFRSIDYHILEKALVLYSHEARIRILHCYSDRIKRELLKKVKRYSKAGTLSLTECVEAESIIHKAIEKFWQLEIGGCLEEYMQERKSIIDKVRDVSGEKHFIIPHNLSVKRCEDGIILMIKPVNVDYKGMTHVYDIDWKYPITKYTFIFYRYVLDGRGKVFIDIEGKNELPIYDFQNNCKQGEYFLFLYRLMKLERCYSWIVLSDIIKNVVRTFEQDLLSMKGTRDSFIRLFSKLPYREPVRPLNYREKILKGISDSGRIMDVLEGVDGKTWMREDIKREFRINVYHGDFKNKNRCCDVDNVDFWAIRNSTFYGMVLYSNTYDSEIEQIFFYANYLGDLMAGGLFENVGQADELLRIIREVLLIVLMTEQQDNIFFKEWMKVSENIVEKVKIMWRNIL